jgi:hypothetical protein
MNTILDWSVQKFEEKGLSTPTMFRAGGWFADETTLEALNDYGFVLDSSGRTTFVFGKNNVTTPWNLLATTQPYYPNRYDQNSAVGDTLGLWEFPNNGGDSWAFSQEEMYGRYRENYTGAPVSEKRVVTFISHPDWFYMDKPKMDGLLTSIESDLYSDDTGPVIFATLEEVYNIWSIE